MKPFEMGGEDDAPQGVAKVGEPLTIELVPKTAWFENLRSRMTTLEWDRVRKNSYKLANYQCEICGGKGIDQGFNWPVECHEVWEYDDASHIQKLVRLIALCPRCHQVKHFGLTQMRGNRRQAIEHLEAVNNWRRDQAENHVVEAFALWEKRSKHPWTLDLSVLNEQGIHV